MKHIASMFILCALCLGACQNASIARALSTVPATPTSASRTPMGAVPSPSPEPATSFDLALYLVAGGVTPADLVPDAATGDTVISLDEIPRQAEPLLTMDDIVAYNAVTHAFTLTTQGTERLAALGVSVSGPAFVLTVEGEPVYAGAFWTPLSSASYDGVVIMLMPGGTPAFGPYRFELGYPGPDFFQGDDPRSDPRVLDALAQAGKLVP